MGFPCLALCFRIFVVFSSWSWFAIVQFRFWFLLFAGLGMLTVSVVFDGNCAGSVYFPDVRRDCCQFWVLDALVCVFFCFRYLVYLVLIDWMIWVWCLLFCDLQLFDSLGGFGADCVGCSGWFSMRQCFYQFWRLGGFFWSGVVFLRFDYFGILVLVCSCLGWFGCFNVDCCWLLDGFYWLWCLLCLGWCGMVSWWFGILDFPD